MPLFEIETDGHIIITWADSDAAARVMAAEAYPGEDIKRLTKRPRNSWVISKAVLGITLSLIHISEPRDATLSRMPSSA